MQHSTKGHLGVGLFSAGRGEGRGWLWPILAAMLAVAACSHTDPYENLNQVKARPEDPRRLMSPPGTSVGGKAEEKGGRVSEDPLRFVGDLPNALRETDDLRLALTETVAQMSGERSAYDKALWTITPYMLYRAVTSDGGGNATRNALTAGATVLGAWSGSLSARPPEYEQIYAEGTDKLACLMVDSTRYLYTQEELDLAPDGGGGVLVDQLDAALIRYRRASFSVVQAMTRVPPAVGGVTCAVPSDCGARRGALGRSAPDTMGPARRLQTDADARATLAESSLTALSELLSLVRHEAAEQLRIESRLTMQDVTAALRSKRPELAKMSQQIALLKKEVDSGRAAVAKAQSGLKPDASKRADAIFRPLELPASLDKGVAQTLRRAEQDLSAQFGKAEALLARHQRKSQRVDAFTGRLDCESKAPLLRAAASLAPRPTRAASEPVSSEEQLPIR